MKLRFPMYFTSTCIISVAADKILLPLVGNIWVKSVLFGLAVGCCNYIFEKAGMVNKETPTWVGICIIGFGFVAIWLLNHVLA